MQYDHVIYHSVSLDLSKATSNSGVAGLETGGPQKMCHHDDDDHKNTPPHSWALNFNLCHILDPLMSNFAEISICPPPNYSKTMMPCSKIKSLPPKGVYYSLFQSIDAATLTTDWEAKPDQSVVIFGHKFLKD